MADKIVKSIHRIVKGMKDDPNGLGVADELKGIGTSRGEAYINGRGDVSSSSSDGDGSDKDEQPVSSTPPTDDPADNDTGGGGGTNDGSGTPEDAADADDGATIGDPIGPIVSGTDPATSTYTTLNLNTLEGIEYIPPDTWNDPNEPPVYDKKYINLTSAPVACRTGNGSGLTAGQEFFSVQAAYDAELAAIEAAFPPPGYSVSSGGYYLCQDPDYAFAISVTNTGTGTPQFITASGCQTVTLDPPEPDPSETEWPSDATCSMVYDHAAVGYRGNDLDTDCSAAQKSPSECVTLRSQRDPSKYFRYCRLNNGGTKVTQVDSGGVPVPGSITKTTDPDGRVDGFYDSSLDADIK